jgi:hypothetical protein
MNIEWIGLLASYLYAGALLGISELLHRQLKSATILPAK